MFAPAPISVSPRYERWEAFAPRGEWPVFVSTKFPTRTSSSRTVPARSRAKGPTRARGTDLRPLDVAVRAYDRAGTDGGVRDPREREHLATLLQERVSVQAHERMHDGVRLEPDARAHAGRGGIDDRGPGVESAIQAPAPLDLLGRRELAPRVDPPPLPPVLGLDRLDRAALRRQDRDRVGQVKLSVDRVAARAG